MRFTLPFWTVDSYAHDRRAHRHRCRCCRKVLEAGDIAVMARIADKTTWALHADCAEKPHSPGATWGQMLKRWAFGHQIKVWGLSETNPRDWKQIERFKSECGLAA